jgi:hypothetical protein
MKRNLLLVVLGLVLFLVTPVASYAQVTQVEMHIAGYLCGN